MLDLQYTIEDGIPATRIVAQEWLHAFVTAGVQVRVMDLVPRDLRVLDPEYEQLVPALTAEPVPEGPRFSAIHGTVRQLVGRPQRIGRIGITSWEEAAASPALAAPLSSFDQLWVPDETTAALFRDRARVKAVRVLPYTLGDHWFAQVPQPKTGRYVFYMVMTREMVSQLPTVLTSFQDAGLASTARLLLKLPRLPAHAERAAEFIRPEYRERIFVIAEDWPRDKIRHLHGVGHCLLHLEAAGWNDLTLLEAKAQGNPVISVSKGSDGWMTGSDVVIDAMFSDGWAGDEAQLRSALAAAFRSQLNVPRYPALARRLAQRHSRTAMAAYVRGLL